MKNIHPRYSVGIQTHNLHSMSLLNNVFRSSQRHVDSCSSEWPTVQADHQEVSPVQRRRTCHRVFLPMSNDWQNDLQGPILFKSF